MKAALVLGAAVWPGGQASPSLARRARHAAALYARGVVDRIVLTGGLGRNPPEEARVARAICREAGVPDADLFTETRSTTTYENLACALADFPWLARAEIHIVTDRYHRLRAAMTARALGLVARTSCPPPRGTRPFRVLRSYLREALAIPFYWIKLRRLNRRR